MIAARRQALVCAAQAATLGGLEGNGDPYFVALAAGTHGEPLAERLRSGARAATAAYAELARFLREEYAPQAREVDAVGAEPLRDRRAPVARHEPATSESIYAWGWDELHRIEAEMERAADRIAPGPGDRRGAMAVLERIPRAASRASTTCSRSSRS